MLKHLDLFSGLGGFAHGLQDLCGGYETVAFCEIDKACHPVLQKNFPGVPIFSDIRNLIADSLGSLCYIDENGKVLDMTKNLSGKYDAAPGMYEQGMSIGDIAGYYGITRQAMPKQYSGYGTPKQQPQTYTKKNSRLLNG